MTDPLRRRQVTLAARTVLWGVASLYLVYDLAGWKWMLLALCASAWLCHYLASLALASTRGDKDA